MHSHMMKRGGSGDVNWFAKDIWRKGYTWKATTIFYWAPSTSKFGLVPGHAFSIFAVEKLR